MMVGFFLECFLMEIAVKREVHKYEGEIATFSWKEESNFPRGKRRLFWDTQELAWVLRDTTEGAQMGKTGLGVGGEWRKSSRGVRRGAHTIHRCVRVGTGLKEQLPAVQGEEKIQRKGRGLLTNGSRIWTIIQVEVVETQRELRAGKARGGTTARLKRISNLPVYPTRVRKKGSLPSISRVGGSCRRERKNKLS